MVKAIQLRFTRVILSEARIAREVERISPVNRAA